MKAKPLWRMIILVDELLDFELWLHDELYIHYSNIAIPVVTMIISWFFIYRIVTHIVLFT